MNAGEMNASAHPSALENFVAPEAAEKQEEIGETSRHAVALTADQPDRMIQNILEQISRSAQPRVRVATLRIRHRKRRLTFFGWDYYPCLSPEIQQVCDHFRGLGYRIEVTRNWFQKNDIRNVYICW